MPGTGGTGGISGGAGPVLANRSVGAWRVRPVPAGDGHDLPGLLAVLRRQQPSGQPLVLVNVDGEFLIALRLAPDGGPRVLLSDVTAAADYAVAAEVLDLLGGGGPADPSGAWPVGDLGIFADLGLDGAELAAILDDTDMYSDEMLHAIAARLGFATEYAAVAKRRRRS